MSHAAQREARTARRPLLDSPLNKRPSAAPPGAAPSATSEGDLSSASSLSRPGSQSDDQGDASETRPPPTMPKCYVDHTPLLIPSVQANPAAEPEGGELFKVPPTIVRFWSRVHRYQIPGLFVGGGKAVGRRRLRSFI